jgi:electron transfer flavoprotein beta subunit
MAELRILVCVKRVPAPGARIVLTADGQGIDTRNLGFTTSPHEECAVEEGIRLVEQHGGNTTVLALGPPEAAEQLRYALSVGAGSAVLVATDGSDWDAQATARALVTAIGELEAAEGPYDLILFGNESADSGGFQVGIRVARALGRPVVNGIKAIEVDAQPDDTAVLIAKREAPDGLEVYRLALPAVVGVKEGINLPRYPTLPGRLRSKKAEVPELSAQCDAGGLRTLGLRLPVEEVSETTILGTGADAAPVVVDLFEELGLA